MTHLTRLAVAAMAVALAACGGSSADKGSSSNEQAEARGPVFTMHWGGGIAGFDRKLEIFPDGRAHAADLRFDTEGETVLVQSAYDSLLTTLRTLMTHSAGPFRAGVIDDFHFTLELQRADSVVTMSGEANGFPEPFREVFYQLTELTGRILTPPRADD